MTAETYRKKKAQRLAEEKMLRATKIAAPDVFESDLKLPEKVAIIGTGPRGNGRFDKIPPDYYQIALNKATEIPGVKPDLWMSFALAYRDQPWWKVQVKARRFPRLFSKKLVVMYEQPADYTFYYLPHFCEKPGPFQFTNGLLRTGATIAGAALQLCYFHYVKQVLFVGVDMYGADYFDGQVRAIPMGKKDAAWKDLMYFNRMICICCKAGMKLSSLSKTMLCVEQPHV